MSGGRVSPDRAVRARIATEAAARPDHAPSRDLVVAELRPDSGLTWDDKAWIAIEAVPALAAHAAQLEAKLAEIAALARRLHETSERSPDVRAVPLTLVERGRLHALISAVLP